ncbi:MAG: hypothetical protein ACHQ9S_23005 [Candidatus Binatia bacterium]
MTSTVSNDPAATATEQLLTKLRAVRESLSPTAYKARYRLKEIESRLRDEANETPDA